MSLFAATAPAWRSTALLDALPRARPPTAERAAVFIEKDGGLVEPLPDNVDPGRLRLRAGVAEALAALDAHGYALLAVTHQSGLARGHYTRGDFARLQGALERLLHEAAGVRLLDVLVCPHAPAPDGRPACLCRMPAPGLLLRAARRHGIALERSWLIGEGLDPVEAGRRAGCRTALLGDADAPATRQLRQPDLRGRDWAELGAQLTPR